jgi:hypothetical protein
MAHFKLHCNSSAQELSNSKYCKSSLAETSLTCIDSGEETDQKRGKYKSGTDLALQFLARRSSLKRHIIVDYHILPDGTI